MYVNMKITKLMSLPETGNEILFKMNSKSNSSQIIIVKISNQYLITFPIKYR